MRTKTSSRLPAAFDRLAWSNLAAQLAEQTSLAAAPIVAVLALGADAGATGALQTVQTLPFLLLAIPAGVLADRMSRPRLMAAAEMLRVASLIAILVLATLSLLTLPLLAGLGFIGACGTVAYSVAGPALVPALVPADGLSAANGRIELARAAAFAAGPALGGALVGWGGASPAFGAAAALSVCAVALLWGLREPARPAQPQGSAHLFRDLKDGVVFVFGHRLLRPVFVTQFVFGMSFFALLAVYAPYAIRTLGLSAAGVGTTLAVYGIGMVVGALMGARLIRLLSFGRVVAVGPSMGFAGALVMVLTIWMPSPALAALSFFLFGAGPILWVISTTTLRQTVTPQALLGRVSAINIASYGARPAGSAVGAVVGSLYGAETCLVVAALGFLVQAVVILASPVVRLEHQPEHVR